MERFGPVGSFVSFEECRSILPWLVLVVSDRSEAAMLESVKTKKIYHNNNDKNFAGKRHGGHATPFNNNNTLYLHSQLQMVLQKYRKIMIIIIRITSKDM